MFARQRKKVMARASDAPRCTWLRARVLVAAVLVLGLAGAGGWGALWLADPHTLPLRAVRVEGTLRHVSHAQLREVIMPHAAAGFFWVDVDAIKRAVTQLPWVESVSVRRIWPDTLGVEVAEQVAFARWGSGGLVNPGGVLFAAEPGTYPENLPELHGPAGSAAALVRGYRAMSETLAAPGLRIARLVLDERRAWRLYLANGMEVVLGRQDAAARLMRFVRAFDNELRTAAANIRRVDLRYARGFAVSGAGPARRGG